MLVHVASKSTEQYLNIVMRHIRKWRDSQEMICRSKDRTQMFPLLIMCFNDKPKEEWPSGQSTDWSALHFEFYSQLCW